MYLAGGFNDIKVFYLLQQAPKAKQPSLFKYIFIHTHINICTTYKYNMHTYIYIHTYQLLMYKFSYSYILRLSDITVSLLSATNRINTTPLFLFSLKHLSSTFSHPFFLIIFNSFPLLFPLRRTSTH